MSKKAAIIHVAFSRNAALVRGPPAAWAFFRRNSTAVSGQKDQTEKTSSNASADAMK